MAIESDGCRSGSTRCLHYRQKCHLEHLKSRLGPPGNDFLRRFVTSVTTCGAPEFALCVLTHKPIGAIRLLFVDFDASKHHHGSLVIICLRHRRKYRRLAGLQESLRILRESDPELLYWKRSVQLRWQIMRQHDVTCHVPAQENGT